MEEAQVGADEAGLQLATMELAAPRGRPMGQARSWEAAMELRMELVVGCPGQGKAALRRARKRGHIYIYIYKG